MGAPRWRSRRAGLVLVLVASVVLSACQWSMPRFDAAGSGHNSFDTSIGVGDLASVELRTTAVVPGATAGGTPVVAGNLVYVTSGGVGGGLRAFAVDGSTGCAGTPATCAPVWSAAATGDVGQAAVAGGVVVVAVGADLHAYSAGGTTGCSGSPAVCSPLWTAPGWGGTPVVAGGRLFVSAGTRLGSFDAAGIDGCGGEPVVCTPAWSADLGDAFSPFPDVESISPPAVADGAVYVGLWQNNSYLNGGDYGSVVAFDAAGVDGCGGTPTTCAPRWWATTGAVTRSPAVVDGVVVVNGRDTGEYEIDGDVYTTGRSTVSAFDVAGCESGAPEPCQPSWRASTQLGQFGAPYSVAIADGFVHASWSDPTLGPSVATFPLTAAPGCTPATDCPPVRLAPTSPSTAELTVGNGVLYAGRAAFDATGATGCSVPPVVCAPVWTAPVPATGTHTFFLGNGRVVGLVDSGTTQTLTTFGAAP